MAVKSKGQQQMNRQYLGLPALLKSKNGNVIRDSKAWMQQRRPTILNLFANTIYGQTPTSFDSIRFSLDRENKAAMGGKAILKEIGIHVYQNRQSLTIHLVLFIPSTAQKPSPVLLLINHRDKDNADPTRTIRRDFWPAEAAIARGYAIAAFHVSDVAADDPDHYKEGVLRLYPQQTQQASGMKAIGAWAWGASRVMDYLEHDPDIDRARVAVIGHSRGGKAALWCGAQDKRFTITISNNSGCTGAALSRQKTGETILDINTTFPYWFCDTYKNFNGKEDALPIDQHMLIALIAPRAVYVASASEDKWSDPMGEFLSLKYAEPVFTLFGLKQLPVETQPQANVAVSSRHIGYHIRAGGHGLELFDWEKFMDFADGYYSKK